MGVSDSGTPKSSILIGFSIINHPFWGNFWKHPYLEGQSISAKKKNLADLIHPRCGATRNPTSPGWDFSSYQLGDGKSSGQME